MTKRYEIALFVTAFLWGLGFVFMDIAVDELSTFTILSIRFLVSSLLLFMITFKKWKYFSKKDVISGIILGIFLFIAFAFQTYGLLFTTASKNAFLTATNVVFVPVLLFILFKQKIEKKVIFGSLIMMTGIAFVSGLSISGLNVGDMLTLVSAIFFALHIIYIGKLINKDNLFPIVTIQLFVAGTLALITGIISSTLSFSGMSNVIAPLVYVILFSTLITFYLQNYGLANIESSKGAIILSTEAFWGTIGSIIILNENITLSMFIGFGLMFLGIIAVERE